MPHTTTTTNPPSSKQTDLPPQYDPASVESQMRKRWDNAHAWHAEPTDDGHPFGIVIPPPNVTAALHLGHALNNTLQDILIRHARMRGANAMWMPGTDHAGIATQTVVDKRLQAEGQPALKEHKQMEAAGENGRERFIEKVQSWKDEYEKRITDQLKEMGCSCDWDRQRFTMDDQCAAAVREAFFQLFKDGLIYRGKRLVNWDPVTQTALADDEVEMHEVDGHFWYMKYPIVKERGQGDEGPRGQGMDHVIVATTRPETMLGDTAVAVNPHDSQRAHLIGQHVRLPIVNRVIPIIGDDYVTMPDADSSDTRAQYASGFLKVTPAHDPNDYEIGQRHDLPVINVMAPDASIADPYVQLGTSDEVKSLLGLSREDARQWIVNWFKQNDLLEDVKPYRHSVGHSYRSHVPVEPYLSDQWYVKVTDDRLSGAAVGAMASEQRSDHGALNTSGTGVSPGATSSSGTGVSPVMPPTGGISTLQRTRRNLPHWRLAGSIYFVTFRLQSDQLSEPERQIVLHACLHWHTQRAEIYLSVVMPDHVHLLLSPYRSEKQESDQLSNILHSIKSFTAHEINQLRKARGSIWLDESFDRIVRDDHEFEQKWNYMWMNPVNAGLAERPEDYPFLATGEGSDSNDDEGELGELISAVPAEHRRDACATGEAAVNDDSTSLRFFPQRYAKGYQDWHENIRDWCISRQLWWGHRIPVWSRRKGEGIEFERSDAAAVWETDETTFVCLREEDSEFVSKLEAAGFEQDPDVLDTWFSSALWPMSTLGWPHDTDELRTWNPTSVLCTAREIITLWVSRMVMFNLYFRGELPFYDVFIHAMIQDGHGQKMSKSLGNGVDPMDIIHSHGADAMRFTLASMTTHTQDVRMPVDCVDPHTPHPGERFSPKTITTPQGHVVAAPIQERNGKKMVSSFGYASGQANPTDDMPLARNTSQKFDMGGRFANKMWNAVRFALSNLATENKIKPRDGHPSALDLPSRWILSRLTRTIHAVDEALDQYEFANYAQSLYDFFWRDLCDWYIEAVKPTVHDDPAQRTTLAACIDACLRLLHPAMPFITERLWIGLRETGAEREVAGLFLPDHDMLITAAWPSVDSSLADEEAEADFDLIRQFVTAIREVRSTHNAPPKRTLEVSANAPQPTAEKLLNHRRIIDTLAGATLTEVGPNIQRPADAAAAPIGEIEVHVHGLTDPAQERKRLTKRRDELAKQLETLRKRLGNDKYVENAPAHLVQQSRDQLAAAEKEAEQLEAQLAALDT